MDLASLLHDSPSDDLRRRQSRQDPPPDAHAQQLQQQQPSQRPPHHSPPLDRPRDQLRERERAPQDLQHPSHGHVQHPPAYRRSPPPHHTSRPPSPPRHAPQYRAPSAGADFPAHSSQRHQLPPPSSLLSDPMYDVGGHASRRQEGLPHPHDRLGPSPGHPSSSVQVQPFTLEHRTTPSLPPKPQHHHHPHSHPSHHHALSHPNTPSATYIGPPSSRSIHASPPHSHHSSHGPGQGSIPLFPTAVGPGVPPSGPPAHAPPGPPPGGMSLRISEPPPPMYPGSLGHGASPHLQAHSHHSHHRDDRHRTRGGSTSSTQAPLGPGQGQGALSSNASPVMASLQRPAPYDDRDRDREGIRERDARERDRERGAVEREQRERGVERDGGPGPAMTMQGRPRGLTGASVGSAGLPGAPGSSLSSMPPTPIGPGPPPPPGPAGKFLGGYRPPPTVGLSPEKADAIDIERERERGRDARLPHGMERSLDRDERERRGSGSGSAIQDSPGAVRRERDLREREKEREQEQRERERQAMKERERQERHQRELQARERERDAQIQMERERELREREMQEREMREHQRQRELAEREQQLERERQEGYRRHVHELMGVGVTPRGLGLGPGPSLAELEEREREREWQKQQKRMQQQQQQQQQQQGFGHPDLRLQSQGQPPLSSQHEHNHHPPPGGARMGVMGPPTSQGPPQGQVWPRFVQAQMPEEERLMAEREMQERRRMEEMQPRELEWEAREPRPDREPRPSARPSKSRTSAKEREERERAKAAAMDGVERAEPPQRKPRVSAREKEQREREKMERAELEQREREQRELEKREREHQHRAREREIAARHESQYELLEQERLQRVQEEVLRAARAREAQVPPYGGLQHPHHQPHPHPHSAMGTPFGPDVQQIHSKHGGKPGPMGATPLPPDLPPQYQHEREREFRFIPPKGGPGQIHMGIPPRSQQMLPHPQAQHPMGTPHLRQHHLQDMYGPGPMGMQSRRPSPPLMHSHSAPPAFMLPRSGSPPTTLVLPIKNLGTFVYPRTPFPFLDFPPPYTASGAPSDPLDVRATVFLPARFIPLTRPARPRIWGGALIPAVPPLSGAQRQLCAQFSGTHAQYGRPWPDEVREGRRVYTDDSDLFLCALHAGWVSWSQARKARREGNDLRIEVRLTREARYIGGFGNALHARERGEVVEDLGAEDDGRELLSSGWGNGHDGAGMEILNAEFVLPGTAHSFGLRNRSQRMLEYAERRSALGCAPRSSRKRRRLLNGTFAGDESAMQTRLNEDDEELSATRVMVFGTDSSWPEIGFKYHPDALRTILFPQSSSPDGRPAKRRKLGAIADNAPSASPAPESSDDDLVQQQRAVVVETLWESFLISQRGQIPSGELESDKENATEAASGSGRRYVIALLTNAGGTLGKLSKSAAAKVMGATEEAAHGHNATDKHAPGADDRPHANGVGVTANGAAQRSASVNSEKAVVPAATAAGSGSAVVKMSLSTASPLPQLESIARAPSCDESTDDGNGPIQILHRDLGEENFEFDRDGISILSGEIVNGMRKGWKLEAQQWKWVQVGVTS